MSSEVCLTDVDVAHIIADSCLELRWTTHISESGTMVFRTRYCHLAKKVADLLRPRISNDISVEYGKAKPGYSVVLRQLRGVPAHEGQGEEE